MREKAGYMKTMTINDVNLTAVEELTQRQQQRLLEDVVEQTEQYLRQAIKETDWSEIEVLDVVERTLEEEYATVSEETQLSMGNVIVYKLYRYENRYEAPEKQSVYTRGVAHGTKLYRITEQVCREVGIDPETGTLVE